MSARTVSWIGAFSSDDDSAVTSQRLRPHMRVVPTNNQNRKNVGEVQRPIEVILELKFIIEVFARWDGPLTCVWCTVCKRRSVLTDAMPVHSQIIRTCIVHSTNQHFLHENEPNRMKIWSPAVA